MILGRVMLDGRFGVQLDDLCDDDLSHHPDAGLAKKNGNFGRYFSDLDRAGYCEQQ